MQQRRAGLCRAAIEPSQAVPPGGRSSDESPTPMNLHKKGQSSNGSGAMDHSLHWKPPLSKSNRSKHTPAPSLIDRARRCSVVTSALRDIHRSPRLRWSTEEQGGCQGEKSMVRSNQVTRVPTYLLERGREGREIPLRQVVPPPRSTSNGSLRQAAVATGRQELSSAAPPSGCLMG